jgi:hypothetical protein
MTKQKSIISAVPKAPKNNRPAVSLIAQATDKYPQANPNPKGHLAMISGDIRKMADHLESIYDLIGMDEDNPIIGGASIYLNEITKHLKEDADYLDDIDKSLQVSA